MNYNIKPIKADAKNNLSVLVLTSSFPLKNFPVGMHVYNKCKHLVQKGVRVTVLAPHCDGEPFNEIKDGIRIIRFPYFYPFSKQKVAYHHGLVENLKTSNERFYVAGDAAGVEEATAAILEGELSGLHAARELGYKANNIDNEIENVKKKLKNLRKGSVGEKIREGLELVRGVNHDRKDRYSYSRRYKD